MGFLIQHCPSRIVVLILVTLLISISQQEQQCLARIVPLDEMHELSTKLRQDQHLLIRETPFSDDENLLELEKDCDLLDFLETIYGSFSAEARRLAADALATCLVESPLSRERFAQTKKTAEHNRPSHTIVADYIRENAGGAAQIINYAVYNHPANFQIFSSNGPLIDRLISIGTSTHRPASDVMWCLAALSNLAASYCRENEGPCHWERGYIDEEQHTFIGSLESSSLSSSSEAKLFPGDVFIDGEAVRTKILSVNGLARRLKEITCSIVARDGPFPSVASSSSEDAGIIPWAAARLVSILATSPDSRATLEEVIPCMCYLSRSFDHLESHNAHNALYHLGRESSCHWNDSARRGGFREYGDEPKNSASKGGGKENTEGNNHGEVSNHNSDGDDGATTSTSTAVGDDDQDEEYDISLGDWGTLCVDRPWISTAGEACHEIFQVDCEGGEDNGLLVQAAVDELGVRASTACCMCGGGDDHLDLFPMGAEHDEL